ncbi:SxtJ family membrane protein [Tenacibaculum retecalamus]|uniref:SxtJ family membrane protein n=1 Tax=Tenacibaculum retecalamus TaxID=3018315 RepID=UPI0023D92D70|nr:SxtJ family membrane protein [Tenacibaculum retecalamus]WBX71649.1 SxtJ family membrane protein [Tenacibaculum retecalamus]
MKWIKTGLKIIQENSSQRKKQKQFGLLLISFCCIILVTLFYKNGVLFELKQNLLIGVLIILSLITLILPKTFYPFLFVWFFIGFILGEISSFFILGFLYYCCISPITFFLRLKNKKEENQGWVDKENIIDYKKLS